MSKTVKDVMTPAPLTLSADSTVSEAARAMRDKDIGVVLVVEDNQRLCGIITDRDIVVRAVAAGVNPDQTPLSRICSHELTEISPDAPISDAVSLMRRKAIRRIPVMDGDKPVGIVSIGDLAIAQDPNSALGSISAAPPNN
jgi:CBS domain-containing protein